MDQGSRRRKMVNDIALKLLKIVVIREARVRKGIPQMR